MRARLRGGHTPARWEEFVGLGFSTMRRVDWALVSAGVCLGLAAMAVDHLLGDDPALEDPPTFLISAAIILVIAARTSLSLHDHRVESALSRGGR